jgi:hypothetical protein
MTKPMRVASFALFALACTRPAPSSTATYREGARDQCADSGAQCNQDGDCCDSLYCQLSSPYLPAWHTCVALEADGEYCTRATQCACGQCTANRCGPALACGGEGDHCSADTGCCDGLYCNNFSYVRINTCQPLAGDGSYCIRASQCLSGLCTNGKCGAPVCNATDGACQTDTDCCSGQYCNNFTYGTIKCVDQIASGLWCIRDAQCASGSCQSNRCQ